MAGRKMNELGRPSKLYPAGTGEFSITRRREALLTPMEAPTLPDSSNDPDESIFNRPSRT
jgi:hypothetical protein